MTRSNPQNAAPYARAGETDFSGGRGRAQNPWPSKTAVYVDEKNNVWASDFSANAILRFDPQTEKFESFPSTRERANVRQMAGRAGEAWGAESGTDRLVVVRYAERGQ